MDRKGWTNFMNYSESSQIEELIGVGASYLIVSDSDMFEDEFLEPFLNHKIGSYKGIHIYYLSAHE
jgi:hypothetical protein